MTETTSATGDPVRAAYGSSRWLRWLFAAALVLLLVALVLPTLIARSGILQPLVNRLLAPQQIQASIGRATLGWFTPAGLYDVHIADQQQRWDFSADELGSDLTLWRLLTSGGNLGTFVVGRPTLVVALDKPLNLPQRDSAKQPRRTPSGGEQQFRVVVSDGTILVRVADQQQPQEFARQINLNADWQQSTDGRMLTIEPGRPLDHVQLTPEMCDTGLKFIAPIMANVAWTRGTLSLELDECRIPLDTPPEAVVLGRVSLHDVETGLKNPLAQEIARIVATATQRELPDSVRLADNSVVNFEVQDAQVRHSGLEFGLPKVAPELVIRTHGTVGFDRQLDMVADLPMPLQLLGDGPLAQSLGNQTLQLPIRGTLDQPQVQLAGDGQLASELISKLLNPVVSGEVTAEDIVESLRKLQQQRQERRRDRGPLLPRFRDRRR